MKNILTTDQIAEINASCKKLYIENYTINPDGSLDINGDVDFCAFDLNEIPIQFNIVSGDFICTNNFLKTWDRFPKKVGGRLSIAYNNFTNLDGCPVQYVGGCFDCADNKLTSLKGCPEQIGDIRFGDNPFSDEVFNKYKDYYEIWSPQFNKRNFDDLLKDIEEGLE